MNKTIALIALLLTTKTFGCWGPEKNGFSNDWNEGLRSLRISPQNGLINKSFNKELKKPELKVIPYATYPQTLLNLFKQLIPYTRQNKS